MKINFGCLYGVYPPIDDGEFSGVEKIHIDQNVIVSVSDMIKLNQNHQYMNVAHA